MADITEIDKFEALATEWWDPEGPFRTLHHINPVRLRYILEHTSLEDKQVADVGCGGGILAEAMAREGARVTGIDLACETLGAARRHAEREGLAIDYRCMAVEALAEEQPEAFDVVTCLEMLEHVPDPASVIEACAGLLKPGGSAFFSTLNRTPKAYLLAVIGAEYLLGLLPKGTHDYQRFIRPSELAFWARRAGLEIKDITGLAYHPLTRQADLTEDVGVNYLVFALKDA